MSQFVAKPFLFNQHFYLLLWVLLLKQLNITAIIDLAVKLGNRVAFYSAQWPTYTIGHVRVVSSVFAARLVLPMIRRSC